MVCFLSTIIYVIGLFIDVNVAISSYGIIGIFIGVAIFLVGFFVEKRKLQ